jgi:hypothetical protein
MLATALSAATRPLSRALLGLWLAIGLALAAFALVAPDRFVLFSDPHGRARILELIQGASPLAMVVPTFTEPDWAQDLGSFAGWLGIAAATLIVLLIVSRRLRTPWQAATIACLTFFMGGAILTASPHAAARADAARRGALAAIDRFVGDKFRTIDYEHLSRATPERWRELTVVTMEMLPVAERATEATTPSVTLPAGSYEARVWFEDGRSRVGSIRVEALGQAEFGRVEGPLTNPVTVPFELPVDVRRLVIGVSDAQVAATVNRVEIHPRSVEPPSKRDPHFIRVVESVRDRPNAYLAYTDEHAYPERGIFWTRGTAATTILVAPGGASRLTLRLSTGPVTGTVTLDVNGERREVAMSAGQENTVSFEIPAATRLLPVQIQSSSMFRPGEVDPSARDMRGLGCQVVVVLE